MVTSLFRRFSIIYGSAIDIIRKTHKVLPMDEEKITIISPSDILKARRKYVSINGPRITPIRIAAT
jgi:hypothetical protein